MEKEQELKSKKDEIKDGRIFFEFLYYFQNKTPFIYLSILTSSFSLFIILLDINFINMINVIIHSGFFCKSLQFYLLTIIMILIFLISFDALIFKEKSISIIELLKLIRFSFYKDFGNSIGKSLFKSDINSTCFSFVSNIISIERNLATAICIIFFACMIKIKISFFLTVILIALFIIIYNGNEYVDNLNNENRSNAFNSISKSKGFLASFESVESLNNDIFGNDQYCHILDPFEKILEKIEFVKETKDTIYSILSFLLTAVFIYIASYIKNNEIDANDEIFLIFFAIIFAVNEVVYLLSFLENLKKYKIAAKTILSILEKVPLEEYKKEENKLVDQSQFKGKIEFINVGFKYKSSKNDDKSWAIHHLSFVIENGQTVFIVDQHKYNKTLIFQLLTRLYEIEEGEILIDGIDITKINLQNLRDLFSIIPQEIEYSTSSNIDNSHDFNFEKLNDENKSSSYNFNNNSINLFVNEQFFSDEISKSKNTFKQKTTNLIVTAKKNTALDYEKIIIT